LDIEDLTTSISDIQLQQDVCDQDLGPDQPAQVFSGQWVDINGKTLVSQPLHGKYES
jgi:hypothetical protein